MIDPPGFALENFDVIGGTMPNGVNVQGLADLRAFLLDDPERFVRTVTEKLVVYALGPRLEYYDGPTVRRILRNAAADDYKWSSIILGVVQSPAFLMRTAPEAVSAD